MASALEKDWITASGYRAAVLIMIHQGRRRHRWGYVGIPKEHPLYGVGYSEQADCLTQEAASSATVGAKSPLLVLTAVCGSDAEGLIRRSPDIIFDVHGGLTYSGGSGNCPVQAADLWWLGFDCGHCNDGPIDLDPERNWGGVVRELPYVEAECERLAAQLKEYENVQ